MALLVVKAESTSKNDFGAQAGEEIAGDLIAFGLLRQLFVSNGCLADAKRHVCDEIIKDVVALAKSFEYRLGK